MVAKGEVICAVSSDQNFLPREALGSSNIAVRGTMKKDGLVEAHVGQMLLSSSG